MLGFGDPIADAIGLLRPRTMIGPSLEAGGSWTARFDGSPHAKVGMVVRGSCWLLLEGLEPVRLDEGDFYLLGRPAPYVMASSAAADPRHATSVRERAVDGVGHLGPDDVVDTYVCDGQVLVEEVNAATLTDVIPPLVRVRSADEGGEDLLRVSQLLVAEYLGDAAGRSLVMNHLGQLLLVHMLRAHARQAGRPAGWIGALDDDGLARALRAMHADLRRPWTLQELAGISHMSRSAFARAFKEQVGVSPMEHLLQWRMSLARDALRHGSATISELALQTGYGSERAFGTAFRRVVGTSPARFRREAREGDRRAEVAA